MKVVLQCVIGAAVINAVLFGIAAIVGAVL